MTKNIAIYQAKNGALKFSADYKHNTIWATKEQVAALFGIDRSGVVKHLSSIYKSEELTKSSTCAKIAQVQIEGSRKIKRTVEIYNLDAIISVGYRVNSKSATSFRVWATKTLRDHLVQGYTVNRNRLNQLNKTLEIISRSEITEVSGIANLLQNYSAGLDLLDSYDHQSLKRPRISKAKWQLNYDSARALIDEMKYSENSNLFGNERGRTKDHPFTDGNKRIAAALFVYFLSHNDALHNKAGMQIIDNNTLAAVTLMVALSNPNEKDEMILVLMNFLSEN